MGFGDGLFYNFEVNQKMVNFLLTYLLIYAKIKSTSEVKIMAYTKFAEYIRILRVRNHEVMGDTAKLLGVTVPFVSAVENGKRNVPEEWFDIFVQHYNLSILEQKELRKAIEDSRTQVKIDLVHTQNFQREMALQFQRSFDDINEETAKKILELLDFSED